MARHNLNIIKVEGDFENCPGDRINPILNLWSDWEGTFQIVEHWEGKGKINYTTSVPLVIFHAEGDEKCIDIDYFNQFGKVLHCNPELAKTKGIFFNYWAYDYKTRLIYDYKCEPNNTNSFIPRFLCLNGRPDWHRYYVLQTLYDKNMLEGNYVSFLNRYDSYENKNHVNKFLSVYKKSNPIFVKELITTKKTLELDRTNEQIHKDDRTHSNWIYEDTSISLVTETYPDTKRKLFITEKSYKPLANCHFQIWVAQPGIVEFFRNLGFDMFDDFLDHRYDAIEDDVSRFEYAISSLNIALYNIKKLTETQKTEFQKRLKENQKKYFDMRISKEEIQSWL